MTTPKSKVLEIAKLDKAGVTCTLLIDSENNEVKTIHVKKDGSVREFKKGKRTALFGAMELAKKTFNKMLDEGWSSVDVNFSGVAQDLYEKELGVKGKKKKAPPKKSAVASSKPKEPTLKELLKQAPATLATKAKSDLRVANQELMALKQKSA